MDEALKWLVLIIIFFLSYDKALQLDPYRTTFWKDKANLLLKLNRSDDALELLFFNNHIIFIALINFCS